MKIVVQRGNQTFGPYPAVLAKQYLEEGTLLPNDLAREESNLSGEWKAVSQVLAEAGFAPEGKGIVGAVRQAGENLQSFSLSLLFPWKEISSLRWLKNRRFMYLALVGLTPMMGLAVMPVAGFGYWAIALYFSALWALFFYSLFKTKQVVTKFCFLCFFFTGIISIALLMALHQLPPWTSLFAMADSDIFPVRALGMFLGVGIHEELCKAAILFWLIRRPGRLLMPQTVVFYGLMSGLGFGIYEGVNYQQTINREQGVDTAYFLNIARLTSLPFLHAVWTGIAGYFLSFAALYPAKRYGLWVVAILIPAILHATYNTFGWSIIGLASALLGVVLLMTYLSNCTELQKHLRNP